MKAITRTWFMVGAIGMLFGVAHADSYSDTMTLFKNARESASFFHKCYGYAVFPTIGKDLTYCRKNRISVEFVKERCTFAGILEQSHGVAVTVRMRDTEKHSYRADHEPRTRYRFHIYLLIRLI